MPGQILPYRVDEHGVATLTLRQEGRPVVVLDSALLDAISASLDAIAAVPGLAGFVLASDSRVFVAGANLQEINGLTDDQLHAYLEMGARAFAKIAALPCTSVAAIQGAALGGGLEIAMHCDLLVASPAPPKDPGGPSKPYQVGLPEAGLGICPGWGGTALLPARIDAAQAIAQTATGQTMSVDQARELGLFDAWVHDPAALLARAQELARTPRTARRAQPRCTSDADVAPAVMAALENVSATLPGTPAAAAVRDCVRVGLERGWDAACQAERDHLVRLRHTDEARVALEKFLNKS
jgi:3-hydroxyacyl-CoA dehydrogenase/enoyl-CoA hydratase/3-hydroxybutyryl-CoA epimerase/enoyl-CoA isomerase